MSASLFLAFCLAWPSAAGLGQELIVNPGFEQPDAQGRRPKGWSWSGAAEWLGQPGHRWIQIRHNGSVGQRVRLRPEWWKLRVSVRVKCADVRRGKQGWHDARVAMAFYDAQGKQVGGWPPVMCWTGSFDWRTESKDFIVPKNAATLSISCSIFYAAGAVEYDDLSVKPIALRPKLEDARLPAGVAAEWSLASAWKQETPTRGRVCINGLWRFHPQGETHASPPPKGSGWGWVQVPGRWTRDPALRRFGPDIWEADESLAPDRSAAAWYERDVAIPALWRGRRIFLYADNVCRDAQVFVDGRPAAGRIEWPDGRVEITNLVEPGKTARLSLRVSAVPVAPEKWKAMSADERLQAIRRAPLRGLCGDVFLESEPAGERIESVLVMPSVRRRQLGLRLALRGLRPQTDYRVRVRAEREGRTVKEWVSKPFTSADLNDAALSLAFPWSNPVLWDIDRPNFYTLRVRVETAAGAPRDDYLPTRFGFREFWIDGRDLRLNGRRVHLRAFDFQSPSRDNGLASQTACEWTLRRFRALGMNFIYLSTYDLGWGQLRYLDGVLEAADRLGFLMSITMPHPRRLTGVKSDDPKWQYWRRVARWIARKAGNHPSVILYAMGHNWLGYPGDQNPAQLDASFELTEGINKWRWRSRQTAREAEAFVDRIDPTRPIYFHQCGNFSKWITLNCYLDWVPIQERMEWLSAWRARGRKPIFLVEFGMPHQATFQRHRGAPFIWRNDVEAEPLPVEYAAMLFGDAAYDLSPGNLAHYDTVERVYALRGRKFRFSQIFGEYWSKHIEKDFLDVKAEYTRFTWPAFRVWGLPAVSPWDWNDVAAAQPRTVELPVDWTRVQRPGLAVSRVRVSDWHQHPPDDSPYGKPGLVRETVLGRTLRRLNQDLLVAIVGPAEQFTRRDCLFAPGETVRKQLALVNDTPEPATFAYEWTAALAGRRIASGRGETRVAAGEVGFAAVRFVLPEGDDAGGRIDARVRVNGRVLRDAFAIHRVAPAPQPAPRPRVALLDPAGVTAKTLQRLGVPFVRVNANAKPPADAVGLIIGREALRADERALWERPGNAQAEQGLPPRDHLDWPALDRLPSWVADWARAGKKVLVCEQTERVLSRRFGFRTAWPGTRRVFVRCAGHPVLRGLRPEHFRLWRGAPTLALARTLRRGWEGHDPVVDWLGFANTRVWKWGADHTVASALIEKPHAGDFLPLLDCEFDLQYSPLLEYRCPSGGRVLFCQLDISGRTGPEPVVARLWANLIAYLREPTKPARPAAPARYVGGSAGEKLLKLLHVRFTRADDARLPADGLLIVGPGERERLVRARGEIARGLRAGAAVFCLPQTPGDVAGWLPASVKLEQRTVTHSLLRGARHPLLTGVGPSELHWRGKMRLWCVTDAPKGSFVLSPGVIASVPVGRGRIVFCQVSPDQFDEAKRPYLRLSRQRAAQLVSRLLANCGAAFDLPAACDPLRLLCAGNPVSIDLAGEWRFRADPDRKGLEAGWQRPDFDDRGWKRIAAPGAWEQQIPDLAKYDGDAWYRLTVRLPASLPPEGLTLRLGAIDDEDWTFVNGVQVGHIGRDTNPDNYWAAPRVYRVPRKLLRPGRDNVIAVRVRDLRQAGGIVRGALRLEQRARWHGGLYVNEPVATDDPYRYCRW